MARAASPFYYGGDQQLGAALGETLGRALFGDPEAAAKLALNRAQVDNYAANAEESRAHAGLYGKQGDGLDIQNGAARSLPDLIAQMFTHQTAAAAPATNADPLAPLPEADPSAPAHVAFDPQTFRDGLPSLMAAMAQAQGDKVDPNRLIGGLAAMFGNDEFARRGMVGMGDTPGKDFALTPERADDISARDASESLNQAVTTANISAATQRRGQDITAGTTRRGQDLAHTDRRYSTDLAHEDRVMTRDGKYVPMGQQMLTSVFPGARITSGERSVQHNRDVDGAEHSYHLPGDGVETYDMAPLPGETFASAKARMKAKYGDRLVEAIDETHRAGHGPHWHFAVAQEAAATGKGGRAAANKAPKVLNAAQLKMLDTEIKNQVEGSGINFFPGPRKQLRALAVQRFRQSGDPVAAVGSVIDEFRNQIQSRQASAGKPPVNGARKAPDGKWYVKRGDQYFRVDA